MEQYIKIKPFAELTGVSVRTLQYYDEIDLLKPEYINEHGHRFYDAGSFSRIFVIISLKNMGMSLNDIHQYVNNNSFDIRVFIEAEKRRVEAEVMNLQLRLIRLSRLNEQIIEKQEVTPALLPLFSQIVSDTTFSQSQIDNLIKNGDEKLAFNIKDWNTFIKNLNYCFENKLSVKDKKAIQCIRYWKESVLEANQVHDDMVEYAEELYQRNPSNAYGITEETYKYLTKLIDEYNDAK